jgi:hypothetical protein
MEHGEEALDRQLLDDDALLGGIYFLNAKTKLMALAVMRR